MPLSAALVALSAVAVLADIAASQRVVDARSPPPPPVPAPPRRVVGRETFPDTCCSTGLADARARCDYEGVGSRPCCANGGRFTCGSGARAYLAAEPCCSTGTKQPGTLCTYSTYGGAAVRRPCCAYRDGEGNVVQSADPFEWARCEGAVVAAAVVPALPVARPVAVPAPVVPRESVAVSQPAAQRAQQPAAPRDTASEQTPPPPLPELDAVFSSVVSERPSDIVLLKANGTEVEAALAGCDGCAAPGCAWSTARGERTAADPMRFVLRFSACGGGSAASESVDVLASVRRNAAGRLVVDLTPQTSAGSVWMETPA